MQVKCPHCRYKYNEMLKPGITELVSICPRCGQSFPLEVTDEDIKQEQIPPLPPKVEEPPVVPTDSSATPVFTSPSVTGHDAIPVVPADNSGVPPIPRSAATGGALTAERRKNTQSPVHNSNHGQYGNNVNHYNYSPPPKGGVMKSMPGIVIFILVATITAGAIFGLSKIFGKDEAEPVDTMSSFISASDMTKGEMGNFSYNFEGNIIGSKKTLPIRMKLTKTGSEIEGSYYYVNQKPAMTLELKGKVADDGTITLREYSDGEEDSGSFEGALANDGSFKGTFRYLKSKFKFELKRIKSNSVDK